MTAGSNDENAGRAAFEPILISIPEDMTPPPAAVPGAPFIGEAEEAVDIRGVRLFMHVFDARLRSASLRSSRFTIEPGCGTHEDRHAVREIWFVSQGQLEVCYDGECYRVEAGQALFFEPWRPHFTRNIGVERAEIFSVWWA